MERFKKKENNLRKRVFQRKDDLLKIEMFYSRKGHRYAYIKK